MSAPTIQIPTNAPGDAGRHPVCAIETVEATDMKRGQRPDAKLPTGNSM